MIKSKDEIQIKGKGWSSVKFGKPSPMKLDPESLEL